jgi:4-hydroxybenzoate polyprenyltransferase
VTEALRYPRLFASLVKVEHTVFALPFAYIGAFLAVDGVPGAADLFWITVAMVGARSLAMALNRLIDAGIDARNPRTAGRELPRGALEPWHVVAFALASLALFLVAVYQLAPIVRWLWPIPVAAFIVYPYLKRVTWLSHAWLGLVDGLAPVGAWAAVTNELPWEAWALGGAVAAWVAGFDILYSLFDVDVDRSQGLHSFASRFGVRPAFAAARACHAATVAFLVAAGVALPAGALYWLGAGAVAALLAYEHSLVSPGDTHRLDTAFFTMNGVISLAFFAFVFADVLL